MSLLETLTEIATAQRIAEISRREDGEVVKGDFKGSVTGAWKELDELGVGIVTYNKKDYYTKPLGFTAIKPGANVQLTFADGVYYSSW